MTRIARLLPVLALALGTLALGPSATDGFTWSNSTVLADADAGVGTNGYTWSN
ncbi:hypothetical protein [Saccharothrix sp. Mg75]|uniref:hypothetical protein n=1 Tax=Saccharothrix sp. Mg75 TaxID=3445357 RepID=UPI003EE930FC